MRHSKQHQVSKREKDTPGCDPIPDPEYSGRVMRRFGAYRDRNGHVGIEGRSIGVDIGYSSSSFVSPEIVPQIGQVSCFADRMEVRPRRGVGLNMSKSFIFHPQ